MILTEILRCSNNLKKKNHYVFRNNMQNIFKIKNFDAVHKIAVLNIV